MNQPNPVIGNALYVAAWIAIIVAGILIGLVPAIIAGSRGRNFFAWWLYGALLFIVALPHSILLKPAEDVAERKCPFCAERIKAEALVCRYCGRDLPAHDAEDARTQRLIEALERSKRTP